MEKVVFTFGRLNPPTVGHQKLVDKVKAEAKKQGADARVYLSHTQNKKKDPLDYNSKVKYATKAFGSVVTKTNAKTIIQVLMELQSAGYKDVTLIVGSDRIPEFKKLLTKYNGKDYSFNSINFVSAGQRDPDADGVEGMSASKMRALALEGDLASFKTGLPRALQASAKEIYNKLRNIMEEEDKQLDEASLTLQQRQKRSRTMKRLAVKIHRKAQIQKRRMADTKRLQKRALKKARNIMRKKVAGEKGGNYASLSAAQKITIDKMIEKKKGVIAKIAKKLLPKVRRAEMQRLQKMRSGKQDVRETLTLNKEQLDERIDPRKEPNLFRAQSEIEREKARDLKKFDRMRDNARIRDTVYRNRKEGVDPHPVQNPHGGTFDSGDYPDPGTTPKEMDKARTPKTQPRLKKSDPRIDGPDAGNSTKRMHFAHFVAKAAPNLQEKADSIGVDLSVIIDVYENATIDPESKNTTQQQRFQAVNHFVAEAKKCTKENAWNDRYTMTGDKSNPKPYNPPAEKYTKPEADAISKKMAAADPGSKPKTSYVGAHKGTGRTGSYVPGTSRTINNSYEPVEEASVRTADSKQSHAITFTKKFGPVASTPNPPKKKPSNYSPVDGSQDITHVKAKPDVQYTKMDHVPEDGEEINEIAPLVGAAARVIAKKAAKAAATAVGAAATSALDKAAHQEDDPEQKPAKPVKEEVITEGPLVMTRSNAVKTLARIADDQVNKMNDKQLKSFAQVLGKTINKQATGKYVVEKKEDDLKDACWKGYKAVGLKDKNGKKVPNCVPEEKELDEAIIATHYHAGAEKTAKGYRPHVTHKEKGHTMYSGGATYKSKEHAVGHAKAYVDAYAKGGDRHADRVVHNYKTQNQKHMVEDVEYGCESETKKKNDKSYKKLKSFKDVLPASGAGQEGTDELVNKYKQQTPGQ